MICTGCGKRISLSRSYCPHCRIDTNSDQQAHLLSLICFGILAAGGFFSGHLVFGAVLGMAAAFLVQLLHRHLQRPRPEIDSPRSSETD
jgi:predicted amidophosphoribosyltransferase